MPKTSDPYEALASKQVKDQAAGARDLARGGTWSDMELLVGKATTSKSAAVRLYAAAAASDIVHRERLAGGIDRQREHQILAWVSSANPDLSAGLLMLMSAVKDGKALDRIGRFLRDPRNGVRAGAAATLRRMALSHSAADRTDLSERVDEWLKHPKIQPDAVLDLINITGEIGWSELTEMLPDYSHLSPKHSEAVELALERLDQRVTIDGWAGLYRDIDLDVFELPTTDAASAPTWLAMGRTSKATRNGKRLKVAPGKLGKHAARLVFAPPLGSPDDKRRVIQSEGRSYWETSPAEILAMLTEDPESLPKLPEQMPDPTEGLEGTTVPRARALWAWATGDLEQARSGLDALTAKGRPQHALFYFLAKVAEDQEDTVAACLAAGAYLDKSKKNAPFRERANAILERLASKT